MTILICIGLYLILGTAFTLLITATICGINSKQEQESGNERR